MCPFTWHGSGTVEAIHRRGPPRATLWRFACDPASRRALMSRLRAAASPVSVVAIAIAALVAGALLRPAAVETRSGVGYFDATGDVGSPAIAGNTTYDPALQTYTLTGSGTNMWTTR